MQATGCTFAIVALLCLIAVGVFLVATQSGGGEEDRSRQPIGVEVTGEDTEPPVLPELQIAGPTAFLAVSPSPAVAGQPDVGPLLLDQVGYEFERLLDGAGLAVRPASDLDSGRLPDPPPRHPVWTLDVTVERYGHTSSRPGGTIGKAVEVGLIACRVRARRLGSAGPLLVRTFEAREVFESGRFDLGKLLRDVAGQARRDASLSRLLGSTKEVP